MRDETLLATPSESEATDAVAIERWCDLLISAGLVRRTLDGTLDKLYRVASLTRDRLSLEAWRTLEPLLRRPPLARERHAAPPIGDCSTCSTTACGWLAAFHGLMHENMTRNFGWSFLDMGRRVERACNLCEAILLGSSASRSGARRRPARLLFLLELADSFITYRSRYRLEPMLPLVLDLLLVDETNPRSLAYPAGQHLAATSTALPQSEQGGSRTDEQRLMLSLLTAMRLADVEALAKDETRARSCRRRAAQPAAPAAAALRRPSSGATSTWSRRSRTACARAHRAEAMIYDVSHRTTYRYSHAGGAVAAPRAPVAARRRAPEGGAPQPADRAGAVLRTEREDYFGNRVVMLDIEEEHHELVIHARSTIERDGAATCRSWRCRTPWERVVAAHRRPERPASISTWCATPAPPGTRARPRDRRLCAAFVPAGRPVLEARLGPHAAHLRRLHVRQRRRPTSRRRSRTCCSSAAACARTSRTWRSPACARCGCRPATSAATC